MSRVGNKPVTIPEGVNVAQQDGSVTVKGPKGELSETLVAHVTVQVEDADLHSLEVVGVVDDRDLEASDRLGPVV